MVNFFSKLFSRRASPPTILQIIDQAADDFQLPMLDNGYAYLAASRLSLFGSAEHWAIVFETFVFSPRSGHPELTVTTISSKLHNRNSPSDYVSREAYESYLARNPYTEIRSFWPICDTAWIDDDDPEFVMPTGTLKLRDHTIPIPTTKDYADCDIALSEGNPAIFELCRYLAFKYHEDVLASEKERRVSIDPTLEQILSLDEWHHPDLAAGQKPSQLETFQQLAAVLEARDPNLFNTTETANNHWKNWPDGGAL